MHMGAANPAPHWLFLVGAEPHFPQLEQFPTSNEYTVTLEQLQHH